MQSRRKRIRLLLFFTLPAGLLGLILFAAWPGYLSFDSANQFWQAQHADFDDIAPPALPALWALLLPIFPGTSGPLLVIALLYVFGFSHWAWLAQRRASPALAWALALLGPLCPVLLWLLPHLWTDVLLAGTCLAASALIVANSGNTRSRIAILGLLMFATALRHNAICATAPLAVALVWLGWPGLSLLRRGLLPVLLVAVLLAGKTLLTTSLVSQRLDTWALIPLHDLQAVSVATGVQRIPVGLVGPGMDVAQLRAAFNPYSATALFSDTRSGVRNPTISALGPELRAQLLQSWRAVWLEPSYWQQRWRMFRGLLGTHRGAQLTGLGDTPAITPYGDNPTLVVSHPRAHAAYRQLIAALRVTPLFGAGWYLLLAALATALRWRAWAAAWRSAVSTLLASAWAYLLPYFFLAPSAESRYVLWPVLASWLVLLIAVFARRSEAIDA